MFPLLHKVCAACQVSDQHIHQCQRQRSFSGMPGRYHTCKFQDVLVDEQRGMERNQ
jgi:hypothetical protein